MGGEGSKERKEGWKERRGVASRKRGRKDARKAGVNETCIHVRSSVIHDHKITSSNGDLLSVALMMIKSCLFS